MKNNIKLVFGIAVLVIGLGIFALSIAPNSQQDQSASRDAVAIPDLEEAKDLQEAEATTQVAETKMDEDNDEDESDLEDQEELTTEATEGEPTGSPEDVQK